MAAKRSDRGDDPNGASDGREAAALQSSIGYPDIETLALVIANSQIVVTQAMREVADAATLWPLPAGFDEVDVAILGWIASEGRRLGRRVPRL